MNLVNLTNQWGGTVQRCAAHLPAARKYLYGDVVESQVQGLCTDCETERRHAELPSVVRDLLLSGTVSHTRFRYNAIHVYVRDHSSPTGVKLGASIDEPRFDQVFNELRAAGKISSGLSPLSPTEGR